MTTATMHERAEERSGNTPVWGTPGLAGRPMYRVYAAPGLSAWQRFRRRWGPDAPLLSLGLAALILGPYFAAQLDAPEAEEGAGTLFSMESRRYADPRVPEHGLFMGMSPGGLPGEKERTGVAGGGADPLAWVVPMGAGEAAEEEPESEPRKNPETDWKSALKNAVRPAAKAAVKKAGLPVPHRKLAALAGKLAEKLNGSAASSAQAAARLPAPTLAGLAYKPVVQDSLPARAGRGTFLAKAGRGAGEGPAAGFPAGSDRRPGAVAGSAEFLRDAPAAMGGPAARFVPGGGHGGAGDAEKGPSPSSAKDARTITETLAAMKAKLEMQKAVELKWAKKKYNELEKRQMLDKTAAESSARMAEQVVGKVLEGAFALSQAGMAKTGGGEGGGAAAEGGGGSGGGSGGGGGGSSGDSSTACGANKEAAEAQKGLAAGEAGLGAAGQRLARAAGTLQSSSDRFLAPKLSPVFSSAGGKLSRADGAYSQAGDALGKTQQELAQANETVGQANAANGRAEQALAAALDQEGRRVSQWRVDSFTPGQAAKLGAQDPQAQRLQEAQGRQDEARKALETAERSAGAAPTDIQAERARLAGVLAAPDVSAQGGSYPALGQVGAELDAAGGTLARTRADFAEARAAAETAVEKSQDAAEQATEADRLAAERRRGVEQLQERLKSDERRLAELSRAYRQAKDAGDPDAAEQARRDFERVKEQAESRRAAERQKLDALRQRLEEARRVLGKG